MHIEKLDIKGFGKFEGTTLFFGKGINIIYGANEAGKSTLQWFIKGMLYGLKGGRTSKDGIPPPARRFKPWNGGQFGGSLEYRLDDGSLMRVERNFDNNHTAVYDDSFNNITNSFDFSRDKGPLFAEKQLGINETCFERTVLVRQMETRLDEEGRTELFGRVSNTSQTGSEDVSLKKAEDALRDALKNYVGTEKTRTRPVDRISARLEELYSGRVRAVEKRTRLVNTESSLNRIVTEKGQLCIVREYLQKVRELIDLRKRLEEEKSREALLSEILKSILETEKAIADATNQAEAAGGRSGSNMEDMTRINGSYRAAGLKRGKQGRNGANSRREANRMKLLAAAAIFGSLAAGGLGFFTVPVYYIAAGVLLTAGIFLFLMSRRDERTQEEEQAIEELESSKAIEVKLQEVIRLKDTLKDLCGKASAVSGMQAGSAAQVRERLAETAAAAGSAELKLRNGTVEIMKNFPNVDSGFFNSRRLHSIITDSGLKRIEDSWSDEYGKLEEKLAEVTLKIREYETVLKTDDIGTGELQEIDEEIADLELQKSRLEDTGTSLKIALEVLEEAAFEIHRDYAPGLNARMSGMIAKITGGRYHELKADDNLSLLTVSPETGSVTQIPVLSGGTADQMYLALRLATVEMAFQGETLPIILDEAFSQYDDNRTFETLKFLQERYSEGQVLIFTSKGREVDLARAACEGYVNLVRI